MLTSVSATESEVNALLKSVDISKACGVDVVGNSLLELFADGIASSLSRLFNISLANGSFQIAWKSSNIVPIFKKDDHQSKSSLLSSCFFVNIII